MDNFVKQVIEETFASKRQQRYFYAKADDKSLPKKERKKWKKWSKEFSDKTDFSKLPEKAAEEEVKEIVDADGNIISGSAPGNSNAFVKSKKTSDEVQKATMGQMGDFFSIAGGATGGNKTLKYWAEADMSHALGADETIADPSTDFEDAVKDFEELDVPEDEAKERAKQMGYDPQLPDGKMRLIENPLEYIKEYLAKRSKNPELVKKYNLDAEKKPLSPIIKRQLQSMKQTLKDNNLTVKDITEYLEDNEQ